MIILHTADWHLGKQLKKTDFYDDMQQFFDWLIQTIDEQHVDVVLMSGDLFDLSNPSQTSLQQYYGFLRKMVGLNRACKLIITGGNHDSPSVLDAPREVLNMLDITVIGGKPNTIEDVFVPVRIGDKELVVAAVPFLRDRDLRQVAPGESYAEKSDQVKDGLRAYFSAVNEHYTKYYSGKPFIVMGHLYVQGASISDSERDIQMGNLAGIERGVFGDVPHYVALGHIHRPQRASSEHIRYSGSPIPLSFSERSDQKQVVLLQWKNEAFHIEELPIPSWRKLLRFSGSLDEVKHALRNHNSQNALPDLAELRIDEHEQTATSLRRMMDLVETPPNNQVKIIEYRIRFANQIESTVDFLDETDAISAYSPLELFKKRLEQEGDLPNKNDLIDAFTEILDNIYHQD